MANGKVVIVTGAKQGIGLGLARRFARDGYQVMLDDRLDAGLEAEAIRRAGGEAVACVADVSDPAAVDRLFDETLSAYGRVDALVNNAAVFEPGTVLDHDPTVWDRIMGTNLRGVYLCSRTAVRHMRMTGGGSILNISSEYAQRGADARAIYAVAKAGVNQLTRVMAVDHAADGIRVNCLVPGPVLTPLFEKFALETGDPDGIVRREENMTLLKRLGSVEEVAAAASFLVSDAASFVTGAIVAVDGGVTAA